MTRMRLVALLVVLVVGTLSVNPPRVPVPLNCAVDSLSAQHTTAGTLAASTATVHRSQGHAHNDYENGDPLVDALDAGFGSVEADVWAVDGELLVAHTRGEADPSRTLANLYLEPLAERLSADQSETAARLQLLVDVKSSPSTTLPLLREALDDYAPMLTQYRGCTATPGPVSVVVSGRDVRPVAPTAETVSYFGYDMQPERTQETSLHEAVTPLVSAEWDTYFTWDGHGRMPRGERTRLETMVRTAHGAGSAIRFYATPDDRGAARAAIWHELAGVGVDYIGTDDIAGFSAFISAHSRTATHPADRPGQSSVAWRSTW